MPVDTPPNVWSATPTPFNKSFDVCRMSTRRLIEHHVRLGVSGLFLLGTCGEGAWMTDRQRTDLVEAAVKYNQGRLKLAVQVTDNSSARIIDNMRWAEALGADIAVIAPPTFFMRPTEQHFLSHYVDAMDRSPLPVGIYDRGTYGPVVVPDAVMAKLYAHERVILIKDSSGNPDRRAIALAAREKRPELLLLNGDEFICDDYMAAGYDGLLLGGGIFNGYMAGQIMTSVQAGDLKAAARIQKRMNKLMWDVYGGKKISCWLAGLKHLLVEMGIFKNTLNYPGYEVSASCAKAIAAALQREADALFPWKAK